MNTSNIFRFNGVAPFDNWTIKDKELYGYYPRNSIINALSQNETVKLYLDICLIPVSVLTIKRSAFRKNQNIKHIVLLEGLENIEDYVFYETNIETVLIPKSVKHIGKNAFSNCSKLDIAVHPNTYGEKYVIRNKLKYHLVTKDDAVEELTRKYMTYHPGIVVKEKK